jgi:hypothetical protein
MDQVPDGTEILYRGYCAACCRLQGSSLLSIPCRIVRGKVYCLKCYPIAVDVALADDRLKRVTSPLGDIAREILALDGDE